MDIYEKLESNVRGYCRSFPVTFTKAQNATLTDSDGINTSISSVAPVP